MGQEELPDIKEIEDASRQIAGVVSRTPLVESVPLSRLTGKQVFLKLECFQPIKVFKIRGAYNKVSKVKERGVVAASSGNHGIAVAYSSRLLGKKCTIVVPETVVQEKVEAIEDYGAIVVKAGRFSEEREARAREIARAGDSAFIHPFNDRDVIAGQGTCGLEINQQLADFDAVLVPVGGGGLISGVSIALKGTRAPVRVFGVEPAVAPKLTAALSAKRVVRIEPAGSVADGLIPSALGNLTYLACSKYIDGALTVSEEEIMGATRAMVNMARVFAEPSGATPLAPLLSKKEGLGDRVVLVVSGGNISKDVLRKVLVW
ncbi:MAG: threonine/serine dehydratase [Nitrososphaerota archaeon]|jgi:threonine dehydratase|nr:threonine/serine dehydratase [Nitrososphaerota archaeon]MDG6945315.1 threonine/serine dehydratase [Nitrososphaerota archaeon]MDG6949055.1 threonine/serine dehydratase [Nitrososphaerota archaeon]